jgi:hypothetical protein
MLPSRVLWRLWIRWAEVEAQSDQEACRSGYRSLFDHLLPPFLPPSFLPSLPPSSPPVPPGALLRGWRRSSPRITLRSHTGEHLCGLAA